MAGLVPAIHALFAEVKDVDARHKAGHDGEPDHSVWLYSPTSLWVRSTASTALNISRMRASDAGLSTTTTSSGLFEEARTSPQVPSSTVTLTPFTVTRSRMGWPANGSPRACISRSRSRTRSATAYLTSSAQRGDIVGEPQVL